MSKENKKHLVLLDLYNHNNSIFNNILTMNPVCGCNIGCPYCYARKINQRFKHIPDFNKLQGSGDGPRAGCGRRAAV